MTSTPPLWPGFRPDDETPYARAWRDLWATLDAGPLPWAQVRAEVAEAHGLQPRSVDGMIRKGMKAGHLRKRGGYGQRTRRDTRTIERREVTA